jgi:Zn-dependent metalloprotease
MLKIKHEAKGTNLQYGRRTDYATAVDFVDADNSGLMQSSTIPTKTMGLTHIELLKKTYDYFSAIHQRNSFDNAGAAIKLCPF